MAALCNRHSSCCEEFLLQLNIADFLCPTAVIKCPEHYSCPRCMQKTFTLDIYDRNQACLLWKTKKRPYRAGCRPRDKTVDTIRQKHPLTRYTDKTCSGRVFFVDSVNLLWQMAALWNRHSTCCEQFPLQLKHHQLLLLYRLLLLDLDTVVPYCCH